MIAQLFTALRLQKQAADERGDVLVIFAASFMVMLFFVGLAMDASMVLMAHSRLNSVCQLVAQDRLTYQDTVRYSEQPGDDFTTCIMQTLAENQVQGKGEFYFSEDVRTEQKRHYRARLVLQDSCPAHFLRLFGVQKINFSASVDFDDNYGEPTDNVIWSPAASPGAYSGKYSFEANTKTGFSPNELPREWK